MTRAIIFACIVVQLGLTIAGPRVDYELALRAGLVPARFAGTVDGLDGSVPALLTPLTSLFLHADWLHLGFNLVFLAWVGRLVEWVLGSRRFLTLYVLGGLAAGFAQAVAEPESLVPVVGASGAVAAVFGCYAVLFARRRAGPKRVLGRELSSEAATALWFAAVWIGLQLMTGFVFNDAMGGIAIWSHIGGFITGLLFAQPFVRRRVTAP